MIGWYEDVEIGAERRLGEHTFTREAIIEFARAYDPQRFHVDEEAAKASIFGGLCASGWHVAAAAMRAIVDDRAKSRAGLDPLPPLGVSPGVENLRWANPTRPGDTVAYFSRVTAKRETSRPGWGLVSITTWGVNQEGREALRMDSKAFVARRNG
jgi:acyl dehydratase